MKHVDSARICCELTEMCGKGTDDTVTLRKDLSQDFMPTDSPTLARAVAKRSFFGVEEHVH